MDESTNTLLYTATYVIIFIIAVSLAIVLFLSVNRFADSAFEYSVGIETSIINTPTTGLEEAQKGQAHLTSTDVFTYFCFPCILKCNSLYLFSLMPQHNSYYYPNSLIQSLL